ncbi:MAG: pitrilysin family protein [Bacteroidia bacterium]|nr:pitrilysin family protein [Bacteroidia bacterium]
MRSGKTDSGLRYAVLRSGKAVAYCALSIHCGSRDEKGYHSGIAHFTEHTLFKGTSTRSASAVSSYLDRLGGELNAYTTKEEIVLHATVLKEDLRKAEKLLMELATDPVFPEKEIETEKGVVIDEIISAKDSPADDIYDRFEELLFEGHPLGNSILGTAASVRRISSEELQSFTRSRFTPERIAFTVVADVDEERCEAEIKALADRYFRSCAGTAPAEEHSTPEPHRFDKTINKRNHEVNAILGGTAPSLYRESERISAVLLSNLLGGPASNSILNRVLRERHGWVYGVECSYTQYSDSGIMAISLGCDRCNLEKCLAAIRRETQRLAQELISAGRLAAAKKQLIGQLAISSDSGETLCLSMGKSLLSFGRIASDEENRSSIERVTAGGLREIAESVFSENNISKLIYL